MAAEQRQRKKKKHRQEDSQHKRQCIYPGLGKQSYDLWQSGIFKMNSPSTGTQTRILVSAVEARTWGGHEGQPTIIVHYRALQLH